ncbi:MAG: hypothetical protein J6A75_02325 [Lachnospiraceae bacterium]|nr:hypothetical protein [Lachnospiraceae bacterium]
MAEKMLVTQALDERDLLVKKINDKIEKASFVDIAKGNEDKVLNARVLREEYAKQAQAAYQQIQDLIDRFQKIDAAIVASNASTYIETSYGRFTVAGAISLRSRMRKTAVNNRGDLDFETKLYQKMKADLDSVLIAMELRNKSLQETAEDMRLSILGKDTKVKNDKPLEVVDIYVKENTTELVDPIEILKKIEELQEKQNVILMEIDTQIKVSNATTFIEI